MKYLLCFFLLCMIFLLFIFLRSSYERKHFRVMQYTVEDPLIPNCFSGKKIAFLSDLHGQIYGEDNAPLISQIRKENPDLICIGGDMMVVKEWKEKDFSAIFHLLDALAPDYPIVYADGNHEQRMKEYADLYPDWYSSFLNELSMRDVEYISNATKVLLTNSDGNLVLKDDCQHQKDSILLSGLSLEMEYYKKVFFVKRLKLPKHYLKDHVPMIQDDRFHIVLAHTPLYIDQYVADGGNLILSGHFHGGCMRLPKIGAVISPQLQLFPRFAWGYRKKKNAHVIVSAGLGTHSVNIRVNDPPELVMITLKTNK